MPAPATARIVHVGDRSVPLPPVLHDLFGALLAADEVLTPGDMLGKVVGADADEVPGLMRALQDLLPELTIHTHPHYGYSLARVGALE